MNQNAIEHAKDNDMASSLDAIRRAAKHARKLAAQTGTALIVRHGERIDRIVFPDQETLARQND